MKTSIAVTNGPGVWYVDDWRELWRLTWGALALDSEADRVARELVRIVDGLREWRADGTQQAEHP